MKRYEFTHDMLLAWLGETDPVRLAQLWYMADSVRRRHVGEEVYLRALCEISNHCCRLCTYCGIRAPNDRVERYRLGESEILASAKAAQTLGYGTLVLQAGEDPGLDLDLLVSLVTRIRNEFGLAITLSLGELSEEWLRRFRQAGADRYLLRFETSNQDLLRRIHPPKPGQSPSARYETLGLLRELGYEVGSGVMLGVPGASLADTARDLEMIRDLQLDMVGVGPYLPHPDTPMAAEHVPVDAETLTYKMIALTRLLLPDANIPSTTALSTLNPREGRVLGLRRGANVIMPNLTPSLQRKRYEIYPNKTSFGDNPEDLDAAVRRCIAEAGRIPGVGPGYSRAFLARTGGQK